MQAHSAQRRTHTVALPTPSCVSVCGDGVAGATARPSEAKATSHAVGRAAPAAGPLCLSISVRAHAGAEALKVDYNVIDAAHAGR